MPDFVICRLLSLALHSFKTQVRPFTDARLKVIKHSPHVYNYMTRLPYHVKVLTITTTLQGMAIVSRTHVNMA